MFDPFAAMNAVIETAKLEAYISLIQKDPIFLEWIRVLLENGCPPKALNSSFEHFIHKCQQGENET